MPGEVVPKCDPGRKKGREKNNKGKLDEANNTIDKIRKRSGDPASARKVSLIVALQACGTSTGLLVSLEAPR